MFFNTPGESRKDKVKAAIASIIEQRRQIKVLRAQYNGCKKSLRNILLRVSSRVGSHVSTLTMGPSEEKLYIGDGGYDNFQ